MFHYDRGLKLTKADLAIDFTRRQPRAFISHAHADHMARHELAFCTHETARLYHLRLGKRPVHELPLRQTIEWAGLKLTAYPAGHCLGSAMLLAEEDGQRLLYTGDFKLGERATAEPAELPLADILVIESTFGDPAYRFAPRGQMIGQLLDVVSGIFARGATPVVQAYALGKAQEVTRILTSHGIGVLQHPQVFAVSEVYRACGVDLGDCRLYGREPFPKHVVVVPPRTHRAAAIAGLRRYETIAVTGWAAHARSPARMGVDHAVPLSDHPDFDELLEAIERTAPRVVYCTHGPVSFVDHLKRRGVNAHRLDQPCAH